MLENFLKIKVKYIIEKRKINKIHFDRLINQQKLKIKNLIFLLL